SLFWLELSTGVRRLVQLAKFAFTVGGNLQEALDQLDRVLFRLRLQQRKAADDFLRLGEGAVGHGDLPCRPPHPGTLRTRQTPLRSEQGAGLGPFLDQVPHPAHFLHRRWKTGFRRLVDREKSHRRSPSVSGSILAASPHTMAVVRPGSKSTSVFE